MPETVQEFKDKLENEALRELVDNICNLYGINDDSKLDSYDFVAGAYLNGSLFTLGEIFDLIEQSDR